MKKENFSTIRKDLKIISDFVKPNSRVLDIGCGDGELLQYLRDNKNADGRGIEVAQALVSKAMIRGLSVIHGDAENDLGYYPDQSFDYAILSQVIQATRKPDEVLREMLRVAKYAIISLPNFAHIKNRYHLMFKGTMPVNKTIPYQWYETPNIHFCSIKDFENFCKKLNFTIKNEIFLSEKYRFKNICNNRYFANLFAEYGIFVIVKNEYLPNVEVEFSLNKEMLFGEKAIPFAAFNYPFAAKQNE